MTRPALRASSSVARFILRFVFLSLAFAAASGCAPLEPVQAWEKGMLARPEMGFDGNRLESRYEEHIYTSKEAASGGAGVGGGGCGCN